MKLSAMAIIWSVMYAFFGFSLLIIPSVFMTQMGVPLDTAGSLISRILGSALVGYAICFFANRKLPAADRAWKNLMIGSMIYNVIDIPITLWALNKGLVNNLGWIIIVLHVFLVFSFGFYVFKSNK